MLTQLQRKKLHLAVKEYKRKYLVKKHLELDESGTRIMINAFLSDVLGYIELDEIKTEYTIKGTYADYVLQLKNVQHIIVEVKAISIDLSENHLRQAKGYCADEGIDWILLTNGRHFILYRVIFEKPLQIKEVFNIDLTTMDLKNATKNFEFITKKCVSSGDLEDFWQRTQAVSPKNLAKYLYKMDVIKSLRSLIRKETSIFFSEEDIFHSIHQVVINKIDMDKPRKIIK